jgi:TRAP transporter TAXI family solute receptor
MKLKNNARAVACAVAALFAVLPVTARAGLNDKAPINYTVDGATATGYFKVVIEAINGIVREVYPGSAATYKPGSPAGGVLNISTGQSDICFTASAPEIAYALDGKAPFKESLKGKFTFVMLLHNGLTVHNVMTKEWADRNGIKSFADIAAKKPSMRLTVNQPANLQSTVSMYQTLFDVYGIKEAEVTKGGTVIRGNAATGFDALRDGKVDVFINGGFVPTAELTDVSRGRELEWIDGDPAKMKEAADRWHFDVITVPKSAYPFLTKDEGTYTEWNALVAGAHVPEETIYKLVKAMADNRDRVRAIHPSLAGFTIQAASRNPTALPYHPGAERFYRETGILK